MFRYTVTVSQDGKEWSKNIDRVPFTIGREKADVIINSSVISRQQLRIGRDEKGMWLEDLGSKNGTYIAEQEIAHNTRIYIDENQKVDIGFELGLSLRITSKEIAEKKVIELPKHIVQEVKQVKVANGPIIKIETKPVLKKIEVPVEKEEPDDLGDMNTVEKKLFAQIRKMVGNEAEELRRSSALKAKEVTDQAHAEKEKILSEAKLEAERILKTSHEEVAHRIQELSSQKASLEAAVLSLVSDQTHRERKISELVAQEEFHRAELAGLEQTARDAEEEMRARAQALEKEQADFIFERDKFQAEYEQFKLDERKMRAMLETELLEAKVKGLQVQAEATRIQEQIEHLRPQLETLRSEKQRFEEASAQYRLKHEEQERALSSLVNEQERVRLDLLRLQKEIEFHRSDISRLETEKALKKEEGQTLITRAEKEVEGLLQKAQEECRDLKAQALRELDSIEQRKTDLRAAIEEESRVLRKSHEMEFQQLVKDKAALSEELRKKRFEAQESCVQLLDEAREQCRILEAEARAACEKIRAEFRTEESEIRVRKESLEIEIAELTRKKLETVEQTKKTGETILREAQKNAGLILKAAEESAAQVLTRERFTFEEEQRKIRQETEAFIESAHRNAQDVLAKAEAESREQKLKLQQSLAEMKQAELFRIKDMKARAEEEIQKKKHDYAKNVSTNVFALVASEMYKAKGKLLDDPLVDEFTRGIKDLVVDTVLDRVGPDDDKLQSILKTSADARSREKIYWQRIKITAFGCAFALMTLIAFPQLITYPRNLIVNAFSVKPDNGSDEFLTRVKAARVKAIYSPKTTPEFKATYVENVLFTTDFLTRLQAQDYQDKWILELNDYFIKDLDVKDTTIIKFVGLESALLKDLVKMKEDADPKNPQVKIAEMKVREKEFRKKLAEIFEDPDKVGRYYKFQEKFWDKYYNPRRPAAQ